MAPRAKRKPASSAADWPALRRWRITRTRGILRRQAPQDLGAAVGAAVVDVEDLVAPAETSQGGLELGGQDGEVLLFVVDRDDDGDLGKGHAGILIRFAPSPSSKIPIHDPPPARRPPLPMDAGAGGLGTARRSSRSRSGRCCRSTRPATPRWPGRCGSAATSSCRT